MNVNPAKPYGVAGRSFGEGIPEWPSLPCDAAHHASRQPLKRLIRIAPWLALGPVTGPLAAGIYRNWRAGEYVLASLYLVATVFWLYDLGRIAGRIVPGH